MTTEKQKTLRELDQARRTSPFCDDPLVQAMLENGYSCWEIRSTSMVKDAGAQFIAPMA